MRPFRANFRSRGNFRARGTSVRGVGRGRGAAPSNINDVPHYSGADTRNRSSPQYESAARQEKFDDRRHHSPEYERRTTTSRDFTSDRYYPPKRYPERDERDDYHSSYNSRRRSRSRSRSPYHEYYRKRSDSHKYRSRSRTRSRSRSHSSGRRSLSPRRRSDSPQRHYRSQSRSPTRNRRIPERVVEEKYQRRKETFINPSTSERNILEDERKQFQESRMVPIPPRKPTPPKIKGIEIETKDLYSDLERAHKERNIINDEVDNEMRDFDMFNQIQKTESPLLSMFQNMNKPFREFSQSLPWNSSPPPKSEQGEPKPAIKSILKKPAAASFDESDSSNQYLQSSSSASMFIPGLGDIEAMEDEETFLYGGDTESRRSMREDRKKAVESQPDFFTKRIEREQDDLFNRFRNVSPLRERVVSPVRETFDFTRRRPHGKTFSPEETRQPDDIRSKLESNVIKGEDLVSSLLQKGGKDFDEVLKSIGMEMVKHLQKKTEKKPSPDMDEMALSYGIKDDMQTSSFFEGPQVTSRPDFLSMRESMWNEPRKEEQQRQADQHYATTTTSQQQQQQQQQPPPQNYDPYSDQYRANTEENANYYQYSNEQYSTEQKYNQNQTQQGGRSNLRVVPIHQTVGGPVAANLKVISTVEHCSSTQQEVKSVVAAAVHKEEPQKPKITSQERQSLLQQRENQYRQLDMMEKEIDRLRKQQGELMRKKQKQKDGHKDPLLLENSKLQDEISRQIGTIKKTIEGLSERLRLGVDDSFCTGKVGEKKQILQVEEKKLEPEIKIERDDETEMEYDYFDPGGHWCKQCNEMLPHLHNFLQHLQDKRHLQGMDPYDRPWLPEALKNPPLAKPPKKGLIAAVKGVQFLMPVPSYYCSLCTEFMGDASCAELHVKSKNHNYKYLQYVLENPYYERCWNLDKAAGISVKTEEMKRKWMEDEKLQKAKRKKLEIEAEQKNKELIKAEAARDKKVHELEETSQSTPSRKPDKSKGKEIKLTLKMEKRHEEKRRRDDHRSDQNRSKSDAGFGKFTWKQKEQKEPERDSIKEAEKEAARLAQAEKAKIAIRLSGKTVIPPAIPWQAIRKPLFKQKKSLPVIGRSPATPNQTIFPLQRKKPETKIETKRQEVSVVDMFTSSEPSEPPPPGTDDTVLPAKSESANDEKEKSEEISLPSPTDIAKAFTGKFNLSKPVGEKKVYGPVLPPELAKPVEIVELDVEENPKEAEKKIEEESKEEVVEQYDNEMSSLKIENVCSLSEDTTELMEDKEEKIEEIKNDLNSTEIFPVVESERQSNTVDDTEKLNSSVINDAAETEDEKTADKELSSDVNSASLECKQNSNEVKSIEDAGKDAEDAGKDAEDSAFEVHIENMLVLDEALFDTE